MFTVAKTQSVARPVGAVFDFLAHFENRPQFESAVVEAALITDGELGVGSRYREVRKVMGLRTTTVHEITGYDRPTHLSFESVSGPVPLTGEYALTEGDIETEVTFTMTMSPKGVMGWFSPMMRRQTERDLDRYYDVLKQVLEH